MPATATIRSLASGVALVACSFPLDKCFTVGEQGRRIVNGLSAVVGHTPARVGLSCRFLGNTGPRCRQQFRKLWTANLCYYWPVLLLLGLASLVGG